MRFLTTLALGALALTIPAAAQDVRYNFDQEANFAQFKTYKWVAVPNSHSLDDITKKQLETALDQELAKKGLMKTDGDDADLYIGYQVAIGTEKQINSWNDGWGMGPGWRGGWYGGGPSMSQATTTTLYIGELALDMYEPPKKQLVWRGVATKTIDPNAKPDKREKNMHKAIAKLLKNYPPKKKS